MRNMLATGLMLMSVLSLAATTTTHRVVPEEKIISAPAKTHTKMIVAGVLSAASIAAVSEASGSAAVH